MPVYSNDEDTIKFSFEGIEYRCSSIFHDDNLQENDYGLIFLTSPYYTAEKDMFSVYVGSNKDKYSVGSIMPIALLDDDDKEILSDIGDYFMKQANLAIRKILSYIVKNHKVVSELSDFHVTQYCKFPTTSVFVYKKSDVGQCWGSLIPSLYDHGYYYLADPFVNDNRERYISGYMQSIVAEKKKLRSSKIILRLIKDYVAHKDFYDYLYQEVLPFNESPFYRFVTLYQAVELLSDNAYYQDYLKATELFNQGKINRNDLRERLIEATNERRQINIIYSNVIEQGQMIFWQKLDALFDKASIEKPSVYSFGSYLYTLRNKIVHEMRRLFAYKNDLAEIVEYFDRNIFNLLVENVVKQL